MSLDPPFALFVLDKQITNEYIDDCLTRSFKGDYSGTWNLWVATDSYEDMPPPMVRPPPPNATEPPLPKDYASPWINKTVEDCAKWLQAMPVHEGANAESVNRDYFLVMDEYSKDDDTIQVCRIVKEEGGVRVDYFPQPTAQIQLEMWTNLDSKYEEKATNYRRARLFKHHKPDRSRFKVGGPYWHEC
ncbi:hypothetical protein NX059_007134 [Plenodomus lindquistii]|nr:hypothetical protein NX059_007134 [Plenodomus lindquistii]